MVHQPKSQKVPESMLPRFQEVVALTDAICRDRLNTEYADFCREMAASLARKRPSPLIGGRAKSWACGVVYTLGAVNFPFYFFTGSERNARAFWNPC